MRIDDRGWVCSLAGSQHSSQCGALGYILVPLSILAMLVLSGCAGLIDVASNNNPSAPSPLSITNVQVLSATTSTCQIAWTTNVAADSTVDYGTSSSYGSSTPVNLSMVMNHSVTISGLAPNATYYYQVSSTDSKGNHGQSGGYTFKTSGLSISGTISPTAGGSGATVALSGAASATTITDGSGNYVFAGLSNGAYAVAPSHAGYTFNPSSQTVVLNSSNATGINFVDSAQTFSISGTIMSTAGGSGALLTLSGTASGTTTANASGAYMFTGLASGSYTVTPSNSGYAFSPASQSVSVNAANVTGVNFTDSAVAVAPTITTQPIGQTVTAGQTATFTVLAVGTAPLSYQWQKNGGNISGATSISYTTPATISADNGSTFDVVVSNSVGSVTSAVATLTVSAPVAPTITAQPTNQIVTVGQTATFAVTATGTAPLSYQWSRNGAAINGATSSTYTTSATTSSDNGAQFTVVVSNGAGSVTSSAATLTVNTALIAPSFSMMSEMYGDAGATAQQRMSQGLLTGADFHPLLTTSEAQFLTGNTPTPAFVYFAIPPEANVSSCYPSSTDSNAATLLTNYTMQLGAKVWRLGMPEFDQGGGCWATGRPSMAGLSDPQAYSTWTSFYLNTKQLSPYLSQTAQQRGYKWMTVSSFAFSTTYALDMGADAALLERNEDEMSGIIPGLAILRGAAAQHGGKDWGIDFSTWRYWSNGATVYSNGRLVTGWSTATFKRNLYIAYMGGANIIHNESADYTTGAVSGSALNPLGQTVQAFYDFAITRHPNRGTPFIPMALMQEHNSGFEPKFGEWMQGNGKWYWQNGYTPGDSMFANLLSTVYPNYNLWGTLPSGAPKVLNTDGSINISATETAYQQALANGADPRPWEPFGNSAWGEIFDVLTNQASLVALQRYKVVVLATGVPMSDSLLNTLTQYVNQGGILVLNAKQMSANSETLAGVHLTTTTSSSNSETWIPDGSLVSEPSYNYTLATPTTATVVAQTAGNPIVTKNLYGAGAVYVTTPDFLANASNTAILNVGQKLLNMLQAQFAVVTVSGPPLEYLIDTDGGKIIVTLVNTDLTGATWNGTLSFAPPSGSYSVQEWTTDTTVASSLQAGQVVVSATVPAFDVRVYVLNAP